VPSPWFAPKTFPGGEPRIWSNKTIVGTGRNLVGADVIQVRIDTKTLTSQIARKGPQIGGEAYKAMKAAHKRLGDAVRMQALENLERSLITQRINVNNANKRRHRGIRAALHDPRNTIVDPSGRYWGVGSPPIFQQYGALSYYRVIERGGGFRGRIWGLLINENGEPTSGPTGKLRPSRKAKRLVEGANIARAQAETMLHEWSGQTFYGSKRRMPEGTKRKIKGLMAQADANISAARAAKYGQPRATRPTGQPLKDWRNWKGSAAAGFRPGGFSTGHGKGGWWFVVRNPVTAKRYLERAITSVMDSDLPQKAYNEEFGGRGLPFRYRRGSAPISGWADEAAAAKAFWAENTTQKGTVGRHQ
jgi:hypothetical protein